MRNENQKRLTLFSKDAVRSNNTFNWNNIRDLGLLKDSTIQVSNFDVKSSSVIPVSSGSIQYISLPEDNSVSTDNLIAHFKFENNLDDSSGNNNTLYFDAGNVITYSTRNTKKGSYSGYANSSIYIFDNKNILHHLLFLFGLFSLIINNYIILFAKTIVLL